MKKINFPGLIKHPGLLGAIGLLTLSVTHSVHAEPSQLPLFLTAPVKPIVMLNMSKDHQLFYKAYDDYSDIDGDGKADTTFKPAYPYYGYFDYKKCYTYSDGVFDPVSFATDGKCNVGSGTTNQWSGNFLNWSTMTRMDTVRKVLYGGARFQDEENKTILERAYIPEDAHAFAKYYNHTEMSSYTPFAYKAGEQSIASGITICNVTTPASRTGLSEENTDPPLMKVVRGNYSLWASAEGWQCRWGGNDANANDPTASGIPAYSSSPKTSEGMEGGDYIVRVRVCSETDLIDEENDEGCRSYAKGIKPAGVLQEYGENGAIQFGLITGSYEKNKSGGVLRKNVGDMLDEVDLNDGIFKDAPAGGSIVRALDALRIVQFRESSGNAHYAGCNWGISEFDDGSCENWGNPQSEIYLESLRYLSGQSATTSFAATDSKYLADLKSPAWVKPVTNANYCAPLNVIQFNASVSSYDGDGLAGASDLNIDATEATDNVGVLEGLSGSYFIGSNGGDGKDEEDEEDGEDGEDNNQLCTPKAFTSLANMTGTCPDAPRLEGTYHIAGLAHHARSIGIPLSQVSVPGADTKTQTVQTFGVALAPSTPKVEISVPGSDTRTVTILPACRNQTPKPEGNCAIVDFKIIEQGLDIVKNVSYGSLYVNWEDSEQGGDYDQDMWGIIEYEVSQTEAIVKTQIVAMSASHIIGFGYVISGTEDDGFHVMSGINGFSYNKTGYCSDATPCYCREENTDSSFGSCYHDTAKLRSKTHIVGTSTAKSLEQPLYYAAKWGGYPKAFDEQAEKEGVTVESLVRSRDVSDSYFFATNPRTLQESLKSAFGRVAAQVGSASTAATSTSRLSDGSKVYQAKFNSTNWDGTLQILEIDEGTLAEPAIATTDTQFVDKLKFDPAARRVLTNVDGSLADFRWANLDADQKEFLDGDGLGEQRVNWIRGADEPGMRIRTNYLGDIVNSSPVYAGKKTPRYEMLPGDAGNKYKELAESEGVIYVGANDGMLHAFDAETLTEIFAFIPNAAFPRLAALTRPDYGSETNPHQFIVDGSLYVSDVYVGGEWKKYLVGSMGAGGRTIFGLDVTIPATPTLLFEFSSAQYSNLGYGMVEPVIAPFKDGKWYAIFGNGSEGGRSSLFVVDLASPGAPIIVEATEGAGITSLALLPNTSGQIERIYAGDLSGNIWRFDTTGGASGWGVNYKVYQAKDEYGNVQPVTGGITLGANSFLKNAIMVYLGTGKYFDHGDNTASATPVHSIYAIADTGQALTDSRDLLFYEKKFTESDSRRIIANERLTQQGLVSHAVDWVNKQGWFMDFKSTAGERVIVKPILISDRLLFTTLIPSDTACDYGGASWAMELIAVGDRNVTHSILDEKANTKTDEMIVSDATVLIEDVKDGKQLRCGISGDCYLEDLIFADGFRGRMNWREIR